MHSCIHKSLELTKADENYDGSGHDANQTLVVKGTSRQVT